MVFWILAVPWLRLIGPGAWIGWVVLALVFSLWWPLFLALTRWAHFRLRVPLILAAPIAWVAVEYIRAYFLTGFPWYYLAHSQYRYLYVIQIADFAGSLGISLSIAVVNAWLVELVTLPLFRTRANAARPADAHDGPERPALVGHDPHRGHALLRGIPGLDGPVPRWAQARALPVESHAGAQVPARSSRGPRWVSSDDRAGDRSGMAVPT